MAIPARAVRRPVTVLMAVLAVTIFGLLSAGRLAVDLLPDIAYPTVTVQTDNEDAAPLSIEQFVTRPIEEAVGVIPGVREMRSVSRAGFSEVILEFDWDQRMDFAALEVREKLGAVRLAQDADVPRVLRFDPSLDPIVRLAFASDSRPLGELRQLAERWLKPQFEGVLGVASARVRGGLDPEVVVEADEDRLAALGLTLADLATALEAENVNMPGGTLRDFNALYLVRTLHEFDDLEQLRRTVVRASDEGRVRVEDVARVFRGHRDREEIARLGGREVVELALYREGSANTVQVAESIREALDELRGDMSDDLALSILSDQSGYIEDAVDQVKSAAWIGGLLAVLVLFFFLRDLPSTVIIALAIPVSVAATFLPMHQFGVSVNIMSLGGLALGVGMLVDSAIVVLEAIARHRQAGADRQTAAIRGASEVSGAVTASILTTVCVFLPIVFVQGIAGQLFRDQALTVCFSLLASLLVALTLIPALAAFDPSRSRAAFSMASLPDEDDDGSDGGDGRANDEPLPPWTLKFGPLCLLPIGDGRGIKSKVLTALFLPLRLPLLVAMLALLLVGRLVGRLFFLALSPLTWLVEGVQRAYPGVLRRALALRWLVVLVTIVLFAGSMWLMAGLGTQLVPDLSQGQFAFQLRLPEGTPLATTDDAVSRIEAQLLDDDRFARVFSAVGSLPSTASGQRTLGENLAQIDFVLPDAADAATQQAAVEWVRGVLAQFPRIEAELLNPSVISTQAPVAVRVYADDLDQLADAAERVVALLGGIDGVADLTTTVEPGSPEVRIDLDRDRASSLGLRVADVGSALRTKIRGDIIGQFREGEERIDIRLRAAETFRAQASQIDDLRLRVAAQDGDEMTIPVSAIADVVIGRGAAAGNPADGARMAEIRAKLDGTVALGSVLDATRGAITTLELPENAQIEMAGQDAELRTSLRSLQLAVVLAIFLVYVVMASQFESLRQPLIILVAVPLALVGVAAALMVTGDAISVLVLIGAVMLAGIVVNNAIVLVDAFNRRHREEGAALDEALIGAGQERLRPILMTTTTTVLALLPMALGLGAGDELRAPLAVTVIGGLSAATVLTLIVIPCLVRIVGGAVPKAVEAIAFDGDGDGLHTDIIPLTGASAAHPPR
ncbi:MAG: efflux RND transporter permease subunit [Acidobacteriota bacterium]